jgi:hypothetical protein
MAQLSNEEFYDKWVPLLADNVFQEIDGERLEQLLADMRDTFAPVASANAQPIAPAVNFDPVLRQLTATHPLGVGELEYNHNNGGFTAYAPLQVDDLGHAQGEWRYRVKGDIGRNPSQTTDSPLIDVKGTANPAGPGKIKAADISDSTEAGRALLTAKDVAAQRTLLDILGLRAEQYGKGQPKFDTLFGDAGALAYLLRLAAGQSAPAAPTAGQVDDTADTFSFLPNPLFPSFAQYKVNGLPGVTGAVGLDAANSYVSGGRIYIKVVGAVAKAGLAVYVAGSGSIPDGQVLLNADPFTGAVIAPPATAPVKPDFTGFDDVSNTISVSHATLPVSELVYDFNGSTGLAVPGSGVISVGNLAGQVVAYARATNTRAEGARAYSQPFTVTTSGTAPLVTLASPQAGRTIGLADVLTLTATSTAGTNPVAKVEFLEDGVKFAEATVAPYATSRAMSTVGAHNYTARVVDTAGLSNLSSPVAVAGSNELNVTFAGDSITAGYNSVQKGGKSPSEYAMARLATPTGALRYTQGYPGESMREFLDQHKQAALGTYVPGKRNVFVFWYYHNDANQRPLAEIQASFVEGVQWAKANGWQQIIVACPVNRTDAYGYTYNASNPSDTSLPYNPGRLQFIDWLNTTLGPQYGVTIAPMTGAPAEYADNYPSNTAVCDDQVHPKPLGALHLGEGMLAEALYLLGYITLKARITDSAFLNTQANPTYLSSPQTLSYSPFTAYEGYVNGYFTKIGGGIGWNSGGPGTIKVDLPNLPIGETCVVEYDEPRAGRGGRIYGATNQVFSLDITKADFGFYDDSTDSGIWYGGAGPVIDNGPNFRSRVPGPRKQVYTRVDASTYTLDYYLNGALVHHASGAPNKLLYFGGWLYSDGSGGDAASEIPTGKVTCSRILAA